MAKKRSRKKSGRGLGCGPGPVSGDCRYDRPLAGLRGRPVKVVLGRAVRGLGLGAGLRGTPAEHRIRAENFVRKARSERWGNDCVGALAALQTSSAAEAEAAWTGDRALMDEARAETHAARADVLSHCGCTAAPAPRPAPRRKVNWGAR